MKAVLFENKYSDNNIGDELLLDGTITVNSGDFVALQNNSSHTIKTKIERKNWGTELVKHNIWKSNREHYLLVKNFTVLSYDYDQIARFSPLSGTTVRNVIDGLSFSNNVALQFNDPWYLKNAQGDQSGMNDFLTVSSPFYPTGAYDQTNGGVFLNQSGPPSWTFPYYSVKAPIYQDAALSQTGETHRFYFQNWSSTNAQLGQVGSNPTGFDQKGVVFTNADAVVTAELKGTQLTNTSTTYENNSQRKFVRANNVLFSVHESIGKVWIEFSRDNGQTWELSNSGSSLFNGAEAKNPSIEFINLDGSTSLILVAAQLNNNGDSKIVASLSKITSTTFLELDYEEWANGDGGSFSTNNYPAIAMVGSSLFMISWVVSDGGYSFVDFVVGEIVNDGFGNLSLNYPTQNQDYISSESIIRNISLYSSKPIQIQNQNELYSCWFAYESEESSQYSRIYVKKFDVGTNYHLNSSNSAEVSSGSGYTQNYNPSIVAFGEGARVCWLGTRLYVDEKEEESPTEGETPVYEHRVIFKDPSYYRYWNFIKTNGNTAHSPSINKTDGNTAYIFGWSEDDGSERVFANNSLNSIYTMVSTTGKDLQLSNGASTSSMYVNTFNSSSLPYSFASTIDINSFYGIQKSSGISISSGREGIVYKDSVQFYFCMGDISVDGEPVEFVELPDTLNVNNQIVINQSVVSKPFDLTNNSDFLYGVQYGIANPSTVTGILNNGKSVGFKVELIDAESNAVIGVFDEVTYNENSLNNYDNLFYQVNTSGIGSRTVKLRLQINENLNADYSISDKYSKTTMFNKQSLKEVSYQGSLAVNDYALNQNYPNPFNPETIISYQLVTGGQVSLKVYDILGKEIVTLVDKEQESGRYQVTFDASKLASGVYICRIIAGDFAKTIKMSMVK